MKVKVPEILTFRARTIEECNGWEIKAITKGPGKNQLTMFANKKTGIGINYVRMKNRGYDDYTEYIMIMRKKNGANKAEITKRYFDDRYTPTQAQQQYNMFYACILKLCDLDDPEMPEKLAGKLWPKIEKLSEGL